MPAHALPPARVGLLARIACTVVLVYAVHFAPNVVRETYLAVALAERATIQVDPYLGLHPDLFDVPGRGAYINNNPGASMIGAVPYAIVRPLLELVYYWRPSLVAPKPPAAYDDPRPNRTLFMNEMRARGLDIRLALAAATIHAGLNVPLAAGATVLVFLYFRTRLRREREAFWLAMLFAFGTPLFFRSAFLNQNLLLAYCALGAFFLLVWRRRGVARPSVSRVVSAGFLLGVGVLCDYSGVPLLAAFGAWIAATEARAGGLGAGVEAALRFAAGAAGPIAVLLAYQWAAFGDPFLPAQAYMPSTFLSVEGWKGVRWPTFDLLWRNLFDPAYGVVAFCPMLIALLCVPLYRARPDALETDALLLVAGATAALYLFSSAIAFAALQWNTGVRYLVPAVPLWFMALAPVLLALPRPVMWLLVVPTLTVSWSVAMTRESVPVSLLRTFTLGFELPWHTVLQRTAEAYLPALADGGSPSAVFVLLGAILWLLWRSEVKRAASASE